MKRLTFLPVVLSIFFYSASALASVRNVSTKQAQGINGSIITLAVGPGYGLNINLMPTNEIIKKAWIDDPSRITLSFDSYLCQAQASGERQQKCNDEGATVIHLRQVNPITFPNLPRSSNGGTLLTLITEGNEGRKIYLFKVVPVSVQPKYMVLNIQPDIQKPPITPSITVRRPPSSVNVVSQRQINSQSQSRINTVNIKPSSQQAIAPIPKSLNTSINQANALVRGLVIASQKGQINPQTKTWKEVQSAVLLLRRGNTKEEAATKTGVPLKLIDQLLLWGQDSR